MTTVLPEWDFSPYYSGVEDPKVREKMSQATNMAKMINDTYRGKVSKGEYTSEEIKELLIKVEDVFEIVYPISMYSRLLTAKDSQNNDYKQFVSEIQEKATKIYNTLVFIGLELNKLDDEKFISYQDDPVLSNYKHYLQDLRISKPYQLVEEAEQTIIMKDQYGKNAWQKLYQDLTSSWTFEMEINGEIKTLTGPEMRALRMNPDPDIRRRAMKIFFNKYEENKLVIVNIFNNLFKDYSIENQKRGYPTPITRRNLGNEIDDEIVKVLGNATSNSYSKLVHRYYKMKKKIIGIDKLTLADIYAPLPEVTKEYSWDEATDLVLKAFGEFDDEFKGVVEKMIAEKRIDAPTGKGKSGGAFCAGASPKEWPWVLMNYNKNINDISTLAHELGHAVHSVLGMKQSILNFGISLVTAEVASVFSERILADYILNNIEMTKQEKIAYLSGQLESNFATSHRQNMFYQFEMMTHELIKEKILTAEEYCDIYESELKKMFGDSVEIPEEYKWEWSSIPHFTSVFHYVYAYNMSNLLVLALYGLYLERGESFIPQFKKLLAIRKAKTPEEMLSDIGIDIRDEAFWDKGLKYLENMVDQLEKLVES